MKIDLKTKDEIEKMKEGGKILSDVIKKTLEKAKAGTSTIELENFASDLIKKAGALPSFKTVKGYKFATCICVNSCVVHGLPSHYVLKNGDILGLDCGVVWKGLHTDASWSIIVGANSMNQNINDDGQDNIKTTNILKKRLRLLEIGKEALIKAIEAAVVGNYVWDIGKAIEDIVEKKGGYFVVHSLTGHGIGKNLHEDPFIPGFPEGKREHSVKIQNGMTLAIEVIYGEKTGKIWYGEDDGWTINIQDGSDAGLFEETVAIVDGKPLILTHLA